MRKAKTRSSHLRVTVYRLGEGDEILPYGRLELPLAYVPTWSQVGASSRLAKVKKRAVRIGRRYYLVESEGGRDVIFVPAGDKLPKE